MREFTDTPLLVFADIHGDAESTRTALSRADELDAHIIIAGDICQRFSSRLSQLLSMYAGRITAVAGNSDSEADSMISGLRMPLVQRISWEHRTVMVTHGHQYTPSYHPHLEPGSIFISGHTHMPSIFYDETDGIIYLNPGSAAIPRGGFAASYALMHTGRIEIRELESDRVVSFLDLA
jgi:hypothetical protein